MMGKITRVDKKRRKGDEISCCQYLGAIFDNFHVWLSKVTQVWIRMRNTSSLLDHVLVVMYPRYHTYRYLRYRRDLRYTAVRYGTL